MNGSVIVDTSIVVDILANVPNIAAAVEEHGAILHAPYALDVEFMNVLRNQWLHRRITPQEGTRLIGELERMIAVRHPHEGLLDRAWALRNNVSAYDSLFVALAEHLDIPLLTRDRRLARSSGHTARIEFIE
ncbi:MAG TPA: type II toxin-antitoxin system VapC family toxin [Thermoanaerobaculia bacterium]|nr:type II toxin-antitoxin system VapC family toxin [Thermoanaerobaculia bacterium]